MTTPTAYAIVMLLLGGANPPDAAVETDVSTRDTLVRIRAGDSGLQVVSIRHPQSESAGTAESVAATSIPLISSINVAGRNTPVRWRFQEQRKEPARFETVFRFTCDQPALELKSVWRAYPGPGPVEHAILIANQGKETILLPLQPTLAFSAPSPSGHTLEHWWVERGASRPSDVGMHRRPIVPGFSSSLVSTPNSGPIPWFSLHNVEGRHGWYAGIEFSGFVRMILQAPAEQTGGPRAVGIVLGLGKSDADDKAYRTRLSPGETFEAPTVFVGCYAGDVDDGANRLRRWVEARLRPPSADNLPLLTNNSWGEGMTVDEAVARRMIDLSAKLGFEMYDVDAGWYRHVGDWRSDRSKFPAGMRALADHIHARGLLFGLWIAWSQGGDAADPTGRSGVLSVRDPAMQSWFPGDYPSAWKNFDFSGATVCLAEPKAVEWCLGDMRRAVREFQVDMLEHDQVQIVEGCDRQTHRHTSSPIDVAYHAARGYYQVQDGLRAGYPKLLFEDCSNGGNLVDYGVLRRTHYVCITDSYDPLSNRRAFYDSSYALPPAMCECYVENRPDKTPANFRYMLRSGMMGWCTIMIDMSRWSPEQQTVAKRQFEIYKSDLRPLIQRADLYHVSQRPDGRHWDGLQYYDPSTGRGVLFAFRGTTPETTHRFQLKGLDPDARYRLVFEDSSSPAVVVAGRELLETGVALALPEAESSELVFLTRQ